MSVSANTLFHFTDFDALKSILRSQGFWPKYSLERLKGLLPEGQFYEESYIPLVSFCDLKLLQILNTHDSKHMQHFGNCGLGLSKKWGVENRVSPVLYVHENSVSSRAISDLVRQIESYSDDSEAGGIVRAVVEQVKFIKPYEGYWQKDIRRRKIIRYYDEREWRYVPKESQYPAIARTSERSFFIDDYNLKLRNNPLNFENSDIKFIVVENDNQKIDLSQTIRRDFKHLTVVQKDAMIASILTIQELKSDY